MFWTPRHGSAAVTAVIDFVDRRSVPGIQCHLTPAMYVLSPLYYQPWYSSKDRNIKTGNCNRGSEVPRSSQYCPRSSVRSCELRYNQNTVHGTTSGSVAAKYVILFSASKRSRTLHALACPPRKSGARRNQASEGKHWEKPLQATTDTLLGRLDKVGSRRQMCTDKVIGVADEDPALREHGPSTGDLG